MDRRKTCHISKYVALIICLITVLVNLCPSKIFASETTTADLVRVGYVIYENYQEGLEGENKSGSGYDYLQKISYYTGWNYEYVYGSFSELYQKLLDGEIDLLSDVAYSEERASEILYSKIQGGEEEYYIFSRNNSLTEVDSLRIFSDYQRVGVNANSLAAKKFYQWCGMFGVTCETVEFHNQEEREAGIKGYDVNLIVATNLMTSSLKKDGWLPFQRVGSAPYYFAFNKDREDLWELFNEAQSRILVENPNFVEDLKRKYHSTDIHKETLLSTEELKYLEQHGTFRIGYLDNYYPLCGTTRKNEETGVLASVKEVMSKKYGMKFEMISFNSADKLLESLNTGEVDMVFPMMDTTWIAEGNHLSVSNPLVTSSVTAVFYGEYSEEIYENLYITKDSIFTQEIISDRYPMSNYVMVETMEDAFEMIQTEKKGCLLVLTDCFNNYKRNHSTSFKLSTTALLTTVDLRIWTRKDDRNLLSIVNKALNTFGADGLQSELVRYATIESDYSFWDFVFENIAYFIIGFAALLAIIFLIAYNKVRKSNQVKNKLAAANEEAEEARKQAEAANKAKTEFLNHMSHDIRTPINGIMGLLEMIQKNREDQDKVDEYLHKIHTSSGHLLSLVNDVLDMSKLESGKTEFDEIAFDLKAMSKEIEEILDTQYQHANITFTPHMSQLEHPYVYGSPIHLKQIILNLGSNALKYNKRNGSVDTYFKEIKEENGMVTYQFKIVDTGIGMSKDFVDNQLFEPFTQANSEGRTKYKGTGLGMPIVKKLITEMGGTITVDSLIDIGSTFVVELPLRVCEPEAVKELSKVYDTNIDGMNLLVVEDNELNMEIVEFMLEDHNVTYTKAMNGQEALNIFKMSKTNEFDMILMDVMMPVMDGLQATRFIRSLKREDAKTIPIIAMTANAFVEDAIKAREAGMDEHLPKPLDHDILISTIAKYRKNNAS